jgi:hypothetical protein
VAPPSSPASNYEVWFRGEGAGVAPSRPGGSLHDFGDGLYFTDSEDVAKIYAAKRMATVESRLVFSLTLERSSLGRVLDLTADSRWHKFMTASNDPLLVGRSRLSLYRIKQELYGQFFEEFLKENKIDISSFDAVIGPEYNLGGKQLCILYKNGQPSKLALRLRAALPQPAPESSGGASAGPDVFLSSGEQATFKAGLKAGLKDILSAENIAAEIPGVVLMFADKAAARDAIRKIKDKFKREGVAKGVAAGVMEWTEDDVRLNLLNHVTAFRLEGMQDAGGLVPYSTMWKIAESQENYAVKVAYYFSISKSLKWKNEIRNKGCKLLREYRYYFGDRKETLFEYDFIEKLAWVLRPTTDAMIQ